MSAVGERRRAVVTPWREGVPPINQVVEVWFRVAIILAVWTGQVWRSVDGAALAEVTHWRPRA